MSWNGTNSGEIDEDLPQVFYPWRRYFARMIDGSIYVTLWSLICIFVFHAKITNQTTFNTVVDFIMLLLFTLAFEPLWLAWIGTTPGKAIFGFQIRDREGKRLTYNHALDRTKEMILSGLGLCIPIYNIVRLWKCYHICNECGTLPWDEDISYTMKDRKAYRGLLTIIIIAANFSILMIANNTQYFPPNRGELTIAEFVENFNYYADFFDYDFNKVYLGKNGHWVKKDIPETVYLGRESHSVPPFTYQLKNGYISSVSFTVEGETSDQQDWLESDSTQMILASLALVGAQEETNIFSNFAKRIVRVINDNIFEDFSLTLSGIQIINDSQYEGYYNAQYYLIPQKEAAESYYKMKFEIQKLDK